MSTDLLLLYTDVEDSLRASLRRLLVARCPSSRVASCYQVDDADDFADLWQAMATDLGLAGLLVAEEDGGAGATTREAAVVLEELGGAVAPVPFLTSAVVATVALVAARHRAHLVGLASGGTTAALAVPLASFQPGDASVRIDLDGRVTGSVLGVAGALQADVLLVPVTSPSGLQLYAVDAGLVALDAVISLDMTRQLADLRLDRVAGSPIAAGATAARAIDQAWNIGRALLASEQVGIAQWCLDSTVEYLGVRRQFGRVVGGFQAVKHRLADLFVLVESARAAARYAAAATAAHDADADIAAFVAQAYCSDVAVRAAEECVQLHAGIGMTWEHPAHLYLKRAKADQLAFGLPGAHRAWLGDAIALPAARGFSHD